MKADKVNQDQLSCFNTPSTFARHVLISFDDGLDDIKAFGCTILLTVLQVALEPLRLETRLEEYLPSWKWHFQICSTHFCLHRMNSIVSADLKPDFHCSAATAQGFSPTFRLQIIQELQKQAWGCILSLFLTQSRSVRAAEFQTSKAGRSCLHRALVSSNAHTARQLFFRG